MGLLRPSDKPEKGERFDLDSGKINVIRGYLPAAAVLMLLACCVMTAAAEELPVEPAALQTAGIRGVQQTDPNLTGLGVRIASVFRSMTYDGNNPLGDYRFNMSHNCFSGANVLFEDGTDGSNGISEHATAIGGILLGLDPAGFHQQAGNFSYIGASVGASVDVYEFWRFVSLYVFAGRPFKADILSLSLGEVFSDWWTRGIENLAESQGLLVIAAAGNGKAVYDPLLYPAAGANVIAVGVLDSTTEQSAAQNFGDFCPPRSEHSSPGPTVDSRCKPDIVAPGRCLVPDANSATGYQIRGDWSSFAAPITAGAAALLLQKAHESPDLAAAADKAGGNCAIKAILLTSARKLPYWHRGKPGPEDDSLSPLDCQQGAGALNAMGAYRILTAGRFQPGQANPIGWDNNNVSADSEQPNVYSFRIEKPQGAFITATVCWNRKYQNKYPFEHLSEFDTNLRLELWAVDLRNPQANTLLQYSDSVNDNVEHIYHPAEPNFTDYQLIIRFSDAPPAAQPSQRYGLAWTAGPDQTAGDIYWYDLNNDGKIDSLDELIHFLIEHDQNNIINQMSAESALKIDSQRLRTLKTNWPAWRKYLPRWN